MDIVEFAENILGLSLFDYQKELIQSSYRKLVIWCGRR